MHSIKSTRVLRALAPARRPNASLTLHRPPPTSPSQISSAALAAHFACRPRTQLFHTAGGPRLAGKKEAKAKAKEYQGPTSFSEMDVLGNTPVPTTAIDVCMSDGFSLNSGVKVMDGDGALLVGGEAFAWRPWEAKGSRNLVNARGQFELPAEAFAVLELLWPRPDLLILGVGPKLVPLSPATRKHLGSIGLRVEILDTANAASQFNLLATERGVDDVAGALIPVGWVEGKGAAAEE